VFSIVGTSAAYHPSRREPRIPATTMLGSPGGFSGGIGSRFGGGGSSLSRNRLPAPDARWQREAVGCNRGAQQGGKDCIFHQELIKSRTQRAMIPAKTAATIISLVRIRRRRDTRVRSRYAASRASVRSLFNRTSFQSVPGTGGSAIRTRRPSASQRVAAAWPRVRQLRWSRDRQGL
jgi:hypothetical protein